MKKTNTIKIFAISCVASSCLFGASSVNTDDIQKSIVIPKEVEKIQTQNKEPLVEVQGGHKYLPVMKDDGSGKKVLVKSFSFDGNAHIASETLQKIIEKSTNQELSFAQMQEVASQITKEFRNQGYFVARAYIPVQDLIANDNTLKITIIEGSYGEFQLTNRSLVKTSIIQGMFDDAKARDNVVSTNTLERSMLIINDTPGAKVTKANVTPGKAVGSSDFIVEADESNRYSGYIIADNYGSKNTGKERLMTGGSINSPFEIGDKLTLSGLVSKDGDLKNQGITYGFPLAYNGLRGEIGFTNTDYTLVNIDNVADDAYDGTSKSLSGKITYPITKTRLETLDISASFAQKAMKDYFTGAITKDREIQATTLELNHINNITLLGVDSKIASKLSTTFGELEIKDTTSKQTDASGINTQGYYQKVNLDLALDLALNSIYSLNSSLHLQQALNNKNLDGSEDMSIGGSNGVKAFPDGEYSAENGILFNTEFLTNLPQTSLPNFSHKLGVFYDVGTADMSDSSKDTTFKKRTLQDIGLGYYGYYKNGFAKIQYARTIGSKVQTENVGDSSRVLAQIGWVF